MTGAPGYFDVLGVQMPLGRWFLPHEDHPSNAVAVIGYGLWQRLFAGDPAALILPSVLLIGAVAAASVVPARRAARVDPLMVLRDE